MRIINLLFIIVITSFIMSCSSEFTSMEQAKNEVNKHGYREGRWVDFINDNGEYINDTTKEYSFYSLTEFQDGRFIGESKLFKKNGKLWLILKPFQDDSVKHEKSLSNGLKYEYKIFYNENGDIESSIKKNKKDFTIEVLQYSTKGVNSGKLTKSEKNSIDSTNTFLTVEGIIYNENGEVENTYYIKFSGGSNYSKTTPDFRKIFEKKLLNEAKSKGIPDSLLIRNIDIESAPYQIKYMVYNKDTLFVSELFKSEVNKYLQNKQKTSSSLVSCDYCGKTFDKKNGYVFNINVTIDHASSYSHYKMISQITSAMGASQDYTNYINKFSKYYCSQRCCNLTGLRVWD